MKSLITPINGFLTAGLIVLSLLLPACSRSGTDAVLPLAGDYTAFGGPEKVSIVGYAGDAMEPFISRDGMYLFFNNNGPNKDVFYATRVTDTSFTFAGPIATINTGTVEGTPTMDSANTFYYVSMANYAPPASYDTLYRGAWNGSTVLGSAPLAGLAITVPWHVNFDVDISPDGTTLYFNDGDFSQQKGFPTEANIAIAVKSGADFVRDPNSQTILRNVNSAKLEYAPAISADGLELFFTRLDLSSKTFSIYRAARSSTVSSFGLPERVSAISGIVEGPALSPDERSLYYHRRNDISGLFELFRVTRP